MSKKLIVAFAILISTIQTVHAKGRKPAPLVVQQTNTPAAAPTPAVPKPDPLLQCQYCKRTFKGSEGKMMRFHAHDADHWLCFDCFYDSIDFAQKYKTRVESIEAARNKKKK